MKIAPVTEHWNAGEQDWSFVRDAFPAIAAWESCTQLQLPGDYRRFMSRYNGGRIYPRLFRVPGSEVEWLGPYLAESDEHCVEQFLSWEDVQHHWRGAIYGDGIPPKHILVAVTAGTTQVLMSLAPEQFGKVYAWSHSTDRWQTGRNQELIRLADSFVEFLGMLYDDADRSDYEAWYMPAFKRLARELEL
jgi:hypothetical protein